MGSRRSPWPSKQVWMYIKEQKENHFFEYDIWWHMATRYKNEWTFQETIQSFQTIWPSFSSYFYYRTWNIKQYTVLFCYYLISTSINSVFLCYVWPHNAYTPNFFLTIWSKGNNSKTLINLFKRNKKDKA